MSLFTSKTITLPDGAEVLLRSPVEDEAQSLINYLDAVRREADGILFSPEDKLPTLEEERMWISAADGRDGLHLAAEADGAIVALADINRGRHVRQRHLAGIGVSVRKAWCGRGLGTVMMRELIAWARACTGIELLTLNVLEDNHRAQAVYRRVGFAEDGRLPGRIKRDGSLVAVVEMSLWLRDPGGAV